jgi:hypothetical protein
MPERRAATTFLHAAEEVLRRHSPGAPLHYIRITEVALGDGLIETRGATPAQTMNAQINIDIQRRSRLGQAPRFRAYGRGFYGLASPVDPLGGAIDHNNERVRRQLRDVLHDLDPRSFEELVGSLLVALGFEDVEVTRFTGDGGIDVRAVLTVGGVTDVRTAVQVKRWTNSVSGRIVNELRGALGPQERGLIITLSHFTRAARAEADAPDRTPITLIDGEQLIDLLVDNEIGVASRVVSILELDEGALSPSAADAPNEPAPEVPNAPTVVSPSRYIGDKALSMWPLPGGRLAWKDTLDTMLRYVAENAPTMAEAVRWTIEAFDRVASPRTARGYWDSVVRPLGLVRLEGERLVVTAEGASYLESPSKPALLAIALENVAGFQEILDALAITRATPVALLDSLREALGVSWETDAQVKWRLGWLENLGAVDEHRGEWGLAASETR